MYFGGWIARALLFFACVIAGLADLRAQAPPDAPLSIGGKWEFGTAETFAPLTFLALGAAAAFRQEQDQFPTFGEGLFGYTKRFGVAFANHASSDYMTGAIFPILLKEDPRYFRKERGGFFHRLFYAGSRIGVTRTDSGSDRFNYSEFLGNATAATLSNIYLPHGDRTTSYSAQTFGLFLASDALTNVAYEFWPDVKRALFHRHRSSTPARPLGTGSLKPRGGIIKAWEAESDGR
jgi:hypothetical protein